MKLKYNMAQEILTARSQGLFREKQTYPQDLLDTVRRQQAVMYLRDMLEQKLNPQAPALPAAPKP